MEQAVFLESSGELHPVEARLAETWPPEDWQSVGVVLAVSGGADSVALFRAMVSLWQKAAQPAPRVRVAHFNHRLRGVASEEDAQWVQNLCSTWNVPCSVGAPRSQGELLTRNGRPSEALARKARYLFLRQVAQKHGARYVATAHTADDQVETILHRIVRGTGMAGLAGMNRARTLTPAVSLIRPFLTFTRQELLQYLADIGQTYRQDASNENLQYTRNRIRLQVLPLLESQLNPKVREAILRLGRLAGEVQSWLEVQAAELLDRVCREQGEVVLLEPAPLAQSPPLLVRECFRLLWHRHDWPQQAMGQHEWTLLAEALKHALTCSAGTVSRWTLPGAIQVEVCTGQLRLRRIPGS